MTGTGDVGQRLEMLVVLQWLDEGAPADGVVSLSATTAATELGLPAGRDGLLTLMSALSDLEERGVVTVGWPGGPNRAARVTIAESVRRDAARQFGRG